MNRQFVSATLTISAGAYWNVRIRVANVRRQIGDDVLVHPAAARHRDATRANAVQPVRPSRR